MISKPLFIMVAESTEIFRPMSLFGCAQASSGLITPSRWNSARESSRVIAPRASGVVLMLGRPRFLASASHACA